MKRRNKFPDGLKQEEKLQNYSAPAGGAGKVSARNSVHLENSLKIMYAKGELIACPAIFAEMTKEAVACHTS